MRISRRKQEGFKQFNHWGCNSRGIWISKKQPLAATGVAASGRKWLQVAARASGHKEDSNASKATTNEREELKRKERPNGREELKKYNEWKERL